MGKVKSHHFRGCFSVNVTPFTEDGSKLDLAAQRRFIDWQISEGVPGIIILGTTGEFLTISDDERHEFVEATVKHVAGRIPVMVGTMNAYTPAAVRYSREAEKLGADGLMIIPPYYYTPTEDEIFAYYKAICEAISIPIMLYNNPFTSNVDMKPAFIAKLTKSFEHVRYIKEASQDVARVFEIVQATDGVMNVFAGQQILESFLLGAVGYVNPFGNYIPGPSTRIWDLMLKGRMKEAREIQLGILEITRIIAEGHPLYGHQCYSKALAAVCGYPVGDVRPPITTFKSLGQEGRERVARLRAVMERLGQLPARKAAE